MIYLEFTLVGFPDNFQLLLVRLRLTLEVFNEVVNLTVSLSHFFSRLPLLVEFHPLISMLTINASSKQYN